MIRHARQPLDGMQVERRAVAEYAARMCAGGRDLAYAAAPAPQPDSQCGKAHPRKDRMDGPREPRQRREAADGREVRSEVCARSERGESAPGIDVPEIATSRANKILPRPTERHVCARRSFELG